MKYSLQKSFVVFAAAATLSLTPGRLHAAVCGDGIFEPAATEECDDGNTTPGDGCTSCKVDPGYACRDFRPSVCHRIVCGDGKVDAGETCDDGNTSPNDGCSATCHSECTLTAKQEGAGCFAEGHGATEGRAPSDDNYVFPYTFNWSTKGADAAKVSLKCGLSGPVLSTELSGSISYRVPYDEWCVSYVAYLSATGPGYVCNTSVNVPAPPRFSSLPPCSYKPFSNAPRPDLGSKTDLAPLGPPKDHGILHTTEDQTASSRKLQSAWGRVLSKRQFLFTPKNAAPKVAMPPATALRGVEVTPNYVADFHTCTPIITTVAGNGKEGFSGDGAAATDALLGGPTGVAIDGSGNLYIADVPNNRIRKVDADSGVITTVAGNGKAGFSGDGGTATEASLDRPWGVAVDGAGNLYIADQNNNRIREVDATSHKIRTLAGNGMEGFSGDGVWAWEASLYAPAGIAVDGAGNLYIADAGNERVRKVDAITHWITTVAGNGDYGLFSDDGGRPTKTGLDRPWGVAVDGTGNLYIANQLESRILKVFDWDASAASFRNIQTVAGTFILNSDGTRIDRMDGFSGDGAAATDALLDHPAGIAMDGSGNLYIADLTNNRIRKVDAGSGVITTVAGNGKAGFSGDGGAATEASLNGPWDVAVDGAGNLYIADSGNKRIRKIACKPSFTPSGNLPPPELLSPDIAPDPSKSPAPPSDE